MFQEVRAVSGCVLSPLQRQLKLQLFNLALDATFAWLNAYQTDGLTVTLDCGRVKFYPRLLRYDGDQLKLVSIVGKTCYLCMCSKGAFADPRVECMDNDSPNTRRLTTANLRVLRHEAKYGGRKSLCASLGLRNPNVCYRLLLAVHTPFVDMRVGGIPRMIRADELHVVELGLLKKFHEDCQKMVRS